MVSVTEPLNALLPPVVGFRTSANHPSTGMERQARHMCDVTLPRHIRFLNGLLFSRGRTSFMITVGIGAIASTVWIVKLWLVDYRYASPGKVMSPIFFLSPAVSQVEDLFNAVFGRGYVHTAMSGLLSKLDADLQDRARRGLQIVDWPSLIVVTTVFFAYSAWVLCEDRKTNPLPVPQWVPPILTLHLPMMYPIYLRMWHFSLSYGSGCAGSSHCKRESSTTTKSLKRA